MVISQSVLDGSSSVLKTSVRNWHVFFVSSFWSLLLLWKFFSDCIFFFFVNDTQIKGVVLNLLFDIRGHLPL